MTRRTGPTAAVLAVVKERGGALCMRCQVSPSTETHHRIGRGMGGSRRPEVNSAPALVRLCHACHHWVSTHPREAEATGWVIRRSDVRPPQEVELVDLFGAAFLLTEDGWVQPTIPVGFYPSDPALHVPVF